MENSEKKSLDDLFNDTFSVETYFFDTLTKL